MRHAAIYLLAIVVGSACSLNANRIGRPGIDFELPPESPAYPPIAEPNPQKSSTPPRLLKQTQPEYPQWAFDRKITGVVMLEIVIGETGQVAAWKVVRSIPELDAAAVRCVRQWQFSPAMIGGKPVATIANAPVSFRIF